MDVQASHVVPRAALGALHGDGDAGVCQDFCWTCAGDTLTFWRYSEGRDARVRSLRLPRAVAERSNAALFVAILPQPRGSAVSVVVVSASGSMAAWMDANYLEEPITCQIAAASGAGISSFSAAVPEDSGSELVFLAAAGCADGSWMLVQGSSGGLHTRQLNAGGSAQDARGVLGKIGSALSWGYAEAFDPSAKIVKRTPSGRPVVDVAVVVLDASRLRVLVLTDASIDCWLVSMHAAWRCVCCQSHEAAPSCHMP